MGAWGFGFLSQGTGQPERRRENKNLLSRQLRTSLPCKLEIRHLWQIAFSTVFVYTQDSTLKFNSGKIGAVYMIPERLSHRREFAPYLPFLALYLSTWCHQKTVMLGRLTPALEFTPVAAPEWKFRLKSNASVLKIQNIMCGSCQIRWILDSIVNSEKNFA